MSIDAQENGNLARIPALREKLGNRARNLTRLNRFIGVANDEGPGGVGPLRPKLHVRVPALLCPREHSVRDLDDLRTRAVVALEPNHVRAREFLPEFEEIARIRPRVRVDGLCGITHDAHVARVAKPRTQKPELQGGDVLILVDREVTVLGAHGVRHLRMLLNHRGRQQKNIGKIDEVKLGFQVLVLGHNPRESARLETCNSRPRKTRRRERVLLGNDHRGFRPFDLGGDVAKGRRIHTHVQTAHGLPYERQGSVHEVRGGASDG